MADVRDNNIVYRNWWSIVKRRRRFSCEICRKMQNAPHSCPAVAAFPRVARYLWYKLARRSRARAHCVEHCLLWGRRSEHRERRGASPRPQKMFRLHESPGTWLPREGAAERLRELPSAAAHRNVETTPAVQKIVLGRTKRSDYISLPVHGSLAAAVSAACCPR